jgi:DNA polymerase-3 subunit gamma/tau
MLLKGLGEVEAAPDRRAAAEMVLIRLCYVAELPTPGDLVRKLTENPPPPPAPAGPPGGLLRANGAAIPAPAPASSAAPVLAGFRDVAALVAERREPTLHGHLVHSVHLVRFAPGVIELRPEPEAPRDLAARLAALLLAATGTRWTIALSAAPGEPTLAQQADTADRARRADAADHPLVRAILDAFPGAAIDSVQDSTADAYGLNPETQVLAGEPDMPEFAPIDADFAEFPEEIDR